MKSLLVMAVAMMLMAGCATGPAPDVTSHYDNFSGLRTDLLSDNLLDSGPQPREVIWLNASRVFENNARYRYFLEVTYMARPEVGWLEIEPGQSLVLTLDGEAVELSGSGSFDARQKSKEGLLQETAIYRVDKLMMQKIAIAQKVTVAVKGKNGLLERQFKEDNFDKFRRFVTRFAL